MQGKKEWQPKMMYQMHLDDLLSKTNFYRLLDRELDLHFPYKATEQYCGEDLFLSLFFALTTSCF
jgi:hypothetical protein